RHVIAERNPSHVFAQIRWEWISSGNASPRIIETSLRAEHAYGLPPGSLSDLRSPAKLCRVLDIRQCIRCTNRCATVAFNVPRETEARREIRPIGVEDVGLRFRRARSVVVLFEARISRIKKARRRVHEHAAADSLL